LIGEDGSQEIMSMKLTTHILTCCALIVMFSLSASSSDPQDEYLKENGGQPALKNRLVLREEQAGFAGVSGRMWVVEPDGRWSVMDIKPAGTGKVRETTRQSGKLTPEELTALAKDLAAHNLVGLPKNVGELVRANPHRIILKFGDKETILNGIAPRRKAEETTREIIEKSTPKQDEVAGKIWSKVAALAHSIEGRTAPYKP
jgi:hypothetical protein